MAYPADGQKAVNLVRYSVPGGVRVVVVEGFVMVVTAHFQLRGALRLEGGLQVGGKS